MEIDSVKISDLSFYGSESNGNCIIITRSLGIESTGDYRDTVRDRVNNRGIVCRGWANSRNKTEFI